MLSLKSLHIIVMGTYRKQVKTTKKARESKIMVSGCQNAELLKNTITNEDFFLKWYVFYFVSFITK